MPRRCKQYDIDWYSYEENLDNIQASFELVRNHVYRHTKIENIKGECQSFHAPSVPYNPNQTNEILCFPVWAVLLSRNPLMCFTPF